jgi:hypothetical protein
MQSVRILGCILITIAIVALGTGAARTAAQDATPAPEIINRTFENLGHTSDASLAPGMTVQLERYTWLPGVVTEMHTHPGEIDIMFVQSGEIAWSVEQGEAQITRAAMNATPGASEPLPPGAAVTLHAGDTVIFDYTTGLQHQGRVIGDAPAVMLVAELFDPSKQT